MKENRKKVRKESSLHVFFYEKAIFVSAKLWVLTADPSIELSIMKAKVISIFSMKADNAIEIDLGK